MYYIAIPLHVQLILRLESKYEFFTYKSRLGNRKIINSMFIFSRVNIVLATIESFYHDTAFKEMTHRAVQVIVFPYLRALFDSIPSFKKLTILADTLTRWSSYMRIVLTLQCLCHIG